MAIENPATETTRPRPLTSLLRFLGWVALIVAAITVVGVFWHRFRMESNLERTLADLDRTDPGWRLEEIEAAREKVPEEKNSAEVVLTAVRRLPTAWPPAKFPDEQYRLLPPNEMLSYASFDYLARELAAVRPALDSAMELADLPNGRYTIRFETNPIAILLPHLEGSRRIVQLLLYQSILLNQKGESKQALTMCRAALNAARSIGDEPFYISQLVRNAGIAHTCQAIERTLGQGEPPMEDMIVLQKLLEDEDAFPGQLIAVRGERAMFHGAIEAVEHGRLTAEQLIDARSDWLENTAMSVWRMDTRQDHALFLSLMTERLDQVRRPLHEQIDLEKSFDREKVRTLPRNALLTRQLLLAMSKMGESFRQKHAFLRCTIAALAAERYRREKHTWPESLGQLCPQFLSALPLDPFDGAALRYHRVEDGVVIYSLGRDGKDNGGTIDRGQSTTTATDIGVRLWDAPKRRQPARSKPPQQPEGAGR